jgi:hypothetical protein
MRRKKKDRDKRQDGRGTENPQGAERKGGTLRVCVARERKRGAQQKFKEERERERVSEG